MDSRNRTHHLQDDLPKPLLQHFKKLGTFDQIYELRTKAMIEGTPYRTHPNYCGGGPWYNDVNVDLQMTELPDYEVYVDDNQRNPAKLVAFYRCLLPTMTKEFQVLAHCAEFQELASDIYL